MKTLVSKIIVGGFHPSFKAGFKSAELRQQITRIYDKVKLANKSQDSLYIPGEIDTDGDVYKEVRVAFVPVQESQANEASTAELLARFPEATLYKVMSLAPILDEDQEAVYKNGLKGKSFEDFIAKHELKSTEWDAACKNALVNSIGDRQLVRNTDTQEVVLFGTQKQYRQIYFSTSARQDIDLRVEKAVEEAVDMAKNSTTVKAGEKQEANF